MSAAKQNRNQLLRLSKLELIKRCKKNKVAYNGSKSDMVDRLIKKREKTTTKKKRNSKFEKSPVTARKS